MKTIMVNVALLLAVTACNADDNMTGDAMSAPDASFYRAAVDNPARSEDDRKRDAGRKPAAVLEFFGIRPGSTVLDLFSGGGYYTELLSRVVGENGTVVAHTNSAYQKFSADETAARYAGERLPNVTILTAENNELSLPKARFDAIVMVLAYHDIYYVNAQGGWPKINGPKLLAELYKGAKPGAILGLVDHYAEAGAPRETGGTTHRIDPGIVIAEVEAAGFVLEEKSDVLRNQDDDYSKNVFEEDIRGKTDRFLLRFRKPR